MNNGTVKSKQWIVMSLVVFGACVIPAWSQESSVWLDSYDKAKQQADEQGKDIFVLLTGSDWCIWCQKLESEVLSQAEFSKAIGTDYVLLKLDFPRNKELPEAIKTQNESLLEVFRTKHGFEGYPTVYLTDSKGTPYARTGYQEGGAKPYLEHLAFLKQAKPLVDVKHRWIENFDIAKAKAQAQGKDLLIDFTGSDWCIWCIRLDKQVFSQAYFKKEAPKDFVFVKLDFPQNKKQPKEIVAQNNRLRNEYSQKYGFEGYPTIYLADAQGKPYAKSGYLDVTPRKYLEQLKLLKIKHQTQAKKSAE